MSNKSIMRTSVVLPFFSMFIFQCVKGNIKDFIISDESDLKRFGAGDSEYMEDLDMNDYGSEMEMYDSCHGGEDAIEKYLPGHECDDSSDFSVDFMQNFLAQSQISIDNIKDLLSQLAKDQRYAALLEQVEGLEELYETPSCQKETLLDLSMNNQEVNEI